MKATPVSFVISMQSLFYSVPTSVCVCVCVRVCVRAFTLLSKLLLDWLAKFCQSHQTYGTKESCNLIYLQLQLQ